MIETEALAQVRQLVARGDLLRAFDYAVTLTEELSSSEKLKQAALLALARSGATDHAQRLFNEWGLGKSEDPDIMALEGRLAKDRALRLTGAARRAAMSESAALYQAVNRKAPGYYPAINAATTTLLSGDIEAAADLARQVLADPAIVNATDYWALATRAEARCVLSDYDSAEADVALAAYLNENHSERASTRRQLKLILAENGLDADRAADLLKQLGAPVTVHYASSSVHSWPRSREAEAAMRERFVSSLLAIKPGAMFGSLSNATEIILAEAALSAGIPLEVVLPVRPAALHAALAATGGDDWVVRMEACCAQAQRVVVTTDDPEAAENSHADFATRAAMGLTLSRAQHLDGEALNLVLSDGGSRTHPSSWGERASLHVEVDDLVLSAQREYAGGDERVTHALIFADILGFSSLQERLLPVFWDTVMKVIGAVAERYGEDVFERNTWGDAVLLVCRNASTAARICIEVQRELARVDGRRFDRDQPPSMRIGAHYGPVFTGWDPVAQKNTHYGRALSKAARIEPITPPGGVYVSEPFAAILLLETSGEYACTYVGTVPLAKGYGSFRMYSLTLT